MKDQRSTPHSPDMEIMVLGGMLIDAEAAERAQGVLAGAADFHRDGNRRCYAAMLRIIQRGDVLDAGILAEELKETGELEAVGGFPFLATLLDAVPTAANIEYHARIVADKARLRRLANAATEVVRECTAPGATGLDMLARAEALIGEAVAAEDRGTSGAVSVASMLLSRMDALESRTNDGREVTGLTTGIPDLDEITCGLQPEDLVILAARPSQGKTALALNLAAHAAIERKKAVGVFSLEMSKEQLADRLLVSEARVNGSRFRRGNLRDDEFPRLANAAGLLNGSRILVDDTAALTIHDMRGRAARMKREAPDLGLVIVDYIQLMSGGGKTENRQQEVSEVSRGLKAMAKSLGLPVVALSQLSRAVEQRPDKRPVLSDLRESGALEQDADVIVFLYRPEYYYGERDKEGNNLEGLAEIIVGKQRNGPTGKVDAHFYKEYTRFEGIQPTRDNPAWTQR